MANSTVSTASTISVGGLKNCIICAGLASDKICKDSNFQMMMDIYWKGIGVDVKPDMNKTFNLCLDCFDSLLQFYQVNDVLVYFESKLKALQKINLNKNVKGILKWQEKGLKLFPFQSQIMQEWGANMPSAEEDLTKAVQDNYEVSLTVESDNDLDESPIPSTSNGANNKRSPVKRSTTTRNQQQGQKRRRAKRVRNSDSEESDESNFSDELNVGVSEEEVSSERSTRSANLRNPGTKAGSLEPEIAPFSNGSGDRVCTICLDKFCSFSTYQKHLRQHRVKENDGKYECRKCSQQFNRQAKLIDHKRTCNLEAVDVTV